jgi:hypothetical protein
MHNLKLQGVFKREVEYMGRNAIQLTMPASASQDPTAGLSDRDFMAWADMDFTDGTIEVDVASVLATNAPSYARGFIGVTFRIDGKNRFESVYLRPLNSRVDDQVRRNHTVQYVAYPDFTFARLRKEEPERYESYVDISMDAWIHMKVLVQGTRCELYVNHAAQPCLVVTDMKHGPSQRGGVGLWIEAGTIGYFSDLKVS